MAKILGEKLSRVVKPLFSNDYSDTIPFELIDYIINVIRYIRSNVKHHENEIIVTDTLD